LHGRGALSLLAVDEAHCISEHGHAFRPDYRALGALRARFPGVPLLALTATATATVAADILTSLGIPAALLFARLSTVMLERGGGAVDLRRCIESRECEAAVAG
jgi:bloom syndrome protein